MGALATMLVPPLSGWLSDARRRRGGARRSFVAAGIAIDVAALIGLAQVSSLPMFAFLLVMATLGSNVALSAYQAMLPETVPRRHWGVVSGVRGVATLAGSVIGFAVAGLAPSPHVTFLAPATAMALGGVLSSRWAMAMDAIPKLRDVGRDLGLWGIATSVPNVVAPLVGG